MNLVSQKILVLFQESEEDLKGVWVTRTSRTPEEVLYFSPGLCASLCWELEWGFSVGQCWDLLCSGCDVHSWREQPSLTLLYLVILSTYGRDQTSVTRQTLCAAKEKFVLVIFFSYKAPISVTEEIKELVKNHPRALPCLGTCGTVLPAGSFLLFIYSFSLFFSSLVFHILV